MEWIIPLTAFIVGSVFGYIVNSLIARKGQAKETAVRAEQAEIELSQYKQTVEDLHIEHGRLLALVTENLNQANQRWNEAAAHLQLTPQQSALPILKNKAAPESASEQDSEQDAAHTTHDAPLQLVKNDQPEVTGEQEAAASKTDDNAEKDTEKAEKAEKDAEQNTTSEASKESAPEAVKAVVQDATQTSNKDNAAEEVTDAKDTAPVEEVDSTAEVKAQSNAR